MIHANLRRWVVPGLVAFFFGGGAPAHGDAIVAPGSLADTGGNSNNIAPFNPWSPTRVQQVYGSSNFSSWTGPEYIQAIEFRTSGQFGESIPNVTISLSTTSKGPDQLSGTFADNTGPDAATVYQGTLPIFSTDPSSFTPSHPRPFDVVINLQHAFLYDPSKGNLLLDITNPMTSAPTFVNASTPTLDAQDVPNDSVSRVLGYIDGHPVPGNLYAFSDLTQGHPDSLGLVTKFIAGGPDPRPQPGLPDVVPEPSTSAVLLLGGALAVGIRRRRRPAV